MNLRTLLLTLPLIAAFLLSACGNKGALTLPPKAPQDAQQQTKSS